MCVSATQPSENGEDSPAAVSEDANNVTVGNLAFSEIVSKGQEVRRKWLSDHLKLPN